MLNVSRYELFGKKSPLDITKSDWENEIKDGKIDLVYIEKYFSAYGF